MGVVERMGGGAGDLTAGPVKRSFSPVTDAGTRVLLLGSLPGERSLAEARYYAHPQNQFWRLIGAVIGVELHTLPYADRLAMLIRHHIGLWDVVASARRTGSTDAAIRDPATNDLTALIATLPRLQMVAFNGATAARHGSRQLPAGMATLTLPSSSPLHTVGIAAKAPAWAAIAAYLRD